MILNALKGQFKILEQRKHIHTLIGPALHVQWLTEQSSTPSVHVSQCAERHRPASLQSLPVSSVFQHSSISHQDTVLLWKWFLPYTEPILSKLLVLACCTPDSYVNEDFALTCVSQAWWCVSLHAHGLPVRTPHWLLSVCSLLPLCISSGVSQFLPVPENTIKDFDKVPM